MNNISLCGNDWSFKCSAFIIASEKRSEVHSWICHCLRGAPFNWVSRGHGLLLLLQYTTGNGGLDTPLCGVNERRMPSYGYRAVLSGHDKPRGRKSDAPCLKIGFFCCLKAIQCVFLNQNTLRGDNVYWIKKYSMRRCQYTFFYKFYFGLVQ